jgi:hypothetical protein
MLHIVTTLSRKFLLQNIRILHKKLSSYYIVLKVFLYIDMPNKVQRHLLCMMCCITVVERTREIRQTQHSMLLYI